MSKNAKLRTRITAILLAFVMAASLLVAGIGVGADVKAATEKTVTVIYTGTADADLYLDGYQANSWVSAWGLVSENSNFTYEETTDENGFTVYSVSFDFSSIYKVGFKLSVGDWNYIEFTWDNINNGDTTKYVYADGTIGTEAPEIEEEPTPVIGTTTFVYAGTGSYSASAINFWVTDLCANGAWTTANSNISSLSSEYTVTTEATTYNEMPAVAVSADTNVCSELYANIWVDGSSISKNGNQVAFDGTVYYIYDDSTITTEAPSTDEGEDDGDEGEEVTPVIGTTTYVYAGDGSYSAAAMGFWVTDLCVNGTWTTANANIGSISSDYTVTTETTTYDGRPAVIVSADTNICTELYADIWIDGTSISKKGNQITFDGTVYYIYDDSTITTEAPSTDDSGEEEDTTKNEYTVTVNVYGEAATIGAGFANESAQLWSSYWKQDAVLSGDWATTVFTLKDEKVYTDFEAQIVVGDEWTSPKYTMTLSNNSATMWIVPEAGSCFDNEADALVAAAEPATSSKVIVHYKTNAVAAWVVGSWFTTEVNGSWGSKDTEFTYQDDWGYVAVVEYDEVVNAIAFKLHQRWNIDGVRYDWYKEDGNDRVVSLSNGFAEVWLTKGSSAISYTCPDGATVFDEATATAFKNYRYVGRQSAKGASDAELVFHYLREDGNYDEWTVGIWAQAANNTWKDAQISQDKELDEYGAATYTVDLSKWPKTEIGFAVNYNNWEKKDYEADRYVDVSKVEAGQVLDVYLYENDGNIYFEPRTAEVSETDAGIDADIVFHYSRTNGDYEGWMVGLWCEKADGTWVNDNVAFDGTDADGLATVTVDLSKFPSEALGFKINKDNWASEDGGDRSIDLTQITEGQIVDVYIYEGDGEVYFEPQVEEEPVEVVTETDVVVEEPVEEPKEETKGGCTGCTGCTGCAVLLPVFAMIIAGAIFIFKKRA